MPHPARILACLLFSGLPAVVPVSAGESMGTSRRYRALEHSEAGLGTWAILDRDGAGRTVDPYFSSLGGGEMGTGVAVSPSFTLSVDRIQFTVCGHDGPSGGAGGGQGRNFVALADAATGALIARTPAPGSDALQPRGWDVKALQGKKVRVEIHDGIAAGAFAWLGVGTIDAGADYKVDFRSGSAEGWTTPTPSRVKWTEVRGGIPFRAQGASMIPAKGVARIRCGFEARKLFFLGCIVSGGKPLETRGHIEIRYEDGSSERYPLLVGFTLDGDHKLLSKSKAIHIHPSGDEFLYYLAIEPKPAAIDRLELQASPDFPVAPLICAITCETSATAEHLRELPDCAPAEEEAAWIESHALCADSPDMDGILAEIRRAHKLQE